MSEIIKIKHTDENGAPLDDKHCFHYQGEIIAEIICSMVCPSTGDYIRFEDKVYIIEEVLYNPARCEAHYEIEYHSKIDKSSEGLIK